MDVLRRSNRGFKVMYLQRLLNKAAVRDRVGGRPLATDGIFGPLTEGSLRGFQGRRPGGRPTGVADATTWTALGLRTEKEHAQVHLFGQPSGTSCWSAAATMIVGNQSVSTDPTHLGLGGGLRGTIADHEAFASSLGWTMLDHSPGVQELVGIVQRTPVWIRGGGSGWAHAVVLSGVYSDLDSTGAGTMFRVHDPWPIGSGRLYGAFADPITMFDASGVHRVPASLDFVLIPR